MGWNYRVFRHLYKNPVTGEEEQYLDIREAYYDVNGTVNGYSSIPDPVGGETHEDLAWQLDAMKKALERPVVDVEQDEDTGSN